MFHVEHIALLWACLSVHILTRQVSCRDTGRCVFNFLSKIRASVFRLVRMANRGASIMQAYYGKILKISPKLLVIREGAWGNAINRPNHNVVGGGQRGDVASFSERSRRGMSSYLRGCVADYRFMLTLTYPNGYPSDGRQVKEHLRQMLQSMARHCQLKGYDMVFYSAFWFLEFQSRGAPHFHLLLTHPLLASWCANRWYEIVGSDDVRHLQAGTRIESLKKGRDGAVAYARKYAAKSAQKEVPADYLNVGRFWGISGLRSFESATCRVEMEKANNEPAARSLLDSIYSLIAGGIRENKVKLLRRKPGLAIFWLHDRITFELLRMRIALLDAGQSTTALFDEAELSELYV